jgi:dipeptidyl aminopeptidase/acylaminoacyl peptidase
MVGVSMGVLLRKAIAGPWQCGDGWIPTFAASIAMVVAVVGFDATAQGASAPRAPTIDDFLNIREFGVVRPSPDGALLAVEITRPHFNSQLIGNSDSEGTDIWIVDVNAGKSKQITNGAGDGSSYWAPIWSPDSQRLAFLTNQGGSFTRPAIWDRSQGSTSVVGGQRGVDIGANFGHSWYGSTMLKWGDWLDSTTLITVLIPAGEVEDDYRYAGALTPAEAWGPLWSRTASGQRSVRVWDNRDLKVCSAGSSLAKIDIGTGAITELFHGSVRAVSVGPGAAYVAAIVATKPRPAFGPEAPAKADAINGFQADVHVDTEMYVFDIRSSRELGRVQSATSLDFLGARRFPRWSTAGDAIAVPAHTPDGKDLVYHVALPDMTLQVESAGSMLDAEALAELTAQAPHGMPAEAAGSNRPDYQSANANMFGDIPGNVFSLPGGLVGVVYKDELSVLEPGKGVKYQMPIPGAKLLFPLRDERSKGSILVSSADQVLRIEVDSSGIHKEKRGGIDRNNTLVAARPDLDYYIYRESREDATNLWVRGSREFKAFALNEYLRDVKLAQRQLIDYTLPTGQHVKGELWLPAGYRSGQRIPLVIEGYPGFVVQDLKRISLTFHKYAANLLVSAGYGFLLVSVPNRSDDSSQEPLKYFAQAVISGANAAIEQGYADPKRIGFRGHSFGGYLALAVESQTDRFGAIVASAPFPDLFDGHDLPFPLEELKDCAPSRLRARGPMEIENEGVPVNLGGPPVGNMDKYLRNSPYFQMQSAKTPLLMLYGEFDADPTGVEKLFVELDRLGVPVQLAQYWGESHIIQADGNVRDAWAREFEWYNYWLRAGR